jgi:inorganic pyrophosphatase
MSLNAVPAGKNLPDVINVIIEIPAHSDPVKYEVDKDSGALFVDRFMSAAMFYPCNYGYIPNTLSDDGDPLDVLVVTPHTVISGSVIQCRPIGILNMDDEAGSDAKIMAAPLSKLTPYYDNWQEPENMPQLYRDRIEHFFEHYKDLEDDKWVKIQGWGSSSEAKAEILKSVQAFNNYELK